MVVLVGEEEELRGDALALERRERRERLGGHEPEVLVALDDEGRRLPVRDGGRGRRRLVRALRQLASPSSSTEALKAASATTGTTAGTSSPKRPRASPSSPSTSAEARAWATPTAATSAATGPSGPTTRSPMEPIVCRRAKHRPAWPSSSFDSPAESIDPCPYAPRPFAERAKNAPRRCLLVRCEASHESAQRTQSGPQPLSGEDFIRE